MSILITIFSFLTTFLSFIQSSNVNYNEIQNIQCLYEINKNMTYNYNSYSIMEREDKLEILYNNTRIKLVDNCFFYKIINDNETLIVTYMKTNNDYLHILKFSKGKNIFSKIINNKFINKFDIIEYNNNYLFISTINEYENDIIKLKILSKEYLLKNNAIAILFDNDFNIINCELFGGILDDYFETIYFEKYNEIVYITGRKKQNSGYDFGNGGNGSFGYIFLVLNDDLSIKNYLIFNNPIVNIEFEDGLITLSTTKDIFVLKTDFTLISSLKFDGECIFAMKMNKLYNAVFTRRELKIYDYSKGKCIYNDLYKFELEIDEIKVHNNYLYFFENKNEYEYNNVVKTIFYNDTISNQTYIYDYFDETKYYDNELLGLPCNFLLKDILYDNDFNPIVYGEYDIIFNYEKFVITSKTIVEERCNVSEGNIYPVGYNLIFSGNALLNDKEVYNNYALTEEGDYQLILEGKKNNRIINFKVYDMDITFRDEALKKWNYEVRINQDYIIDMKYNSDVIIKDVKVNNQSYDFKVDENKKIVSLVFNSENIGTVFYSIDEIVYEYHNQEFINKINYEFIIRYIDNKISLNNQFYNDDEYFIFDFNVLMNNNQLRYLKVDYNNQYEYIPLKNGFNINFKIQEDYDNIDFYIVYDVNGKMYEETLLFNITYDFNNGKNEFGVLEIIKEDDIIKKIVIKTPISEKIKQIKVDNNIEYQYQKGKSYNLIIYALIFISILFIGYKIYKTKKNNSI